jgi:MFS family permease
MTGVTDAGSIRIVLSGSAVGRTFAFALVGRLAYGLLPLCFLFALRNATGSFAIAASASAVLGLATLAMPVQARLIDAHGQRRVLPCYASIYAASLITTSILLGGESERPAGVWIIAGLLLGLSAPALGPSMRAQWREITPEGSHRRVAYSLDSIGEESLYLVGPIAASLLLATGHPENGLLVAAGLVAIGVTALVTSPYVPRTGASDGPAKGDVETEGLKHEAGVRGGVLGVMRHREFRYLLVSMLLFGSAGASCFIGTAALADRLGNPSAVGFIEAAMAVGAIVAGLAWTRLRCEPSWTRTLPTLALIVASAQTGAAVSVPNLWLVGGFAVVTGALAAPVLVVAFTAADALVLPAQRTEASTWISTSMNAGNAGGTAVAGLIAASSARPFIAAACLSVGVATAIAASRFRGHFA